MTVSYISTPQSTPKGSRLGELRISKRKLEKNSMNLNPWYLVAPVALTLLAVSGAMGAQLAVLGVTLGIFFGTLSLGRARPGDATTTNPGH